MQRLRVSPERSLQSVALQKHKDIPSLVLFPSFIPPCWMRRNDVQGEVFHLRESSVSVLSGTASLLFRYSPTWKEAVLEVLSTGTRCGWEETSKTNRTSRWERSNPPISSVCGNSSAAPSTSTVSLSLSWRMESSVWRLAVSTCGFCHFRDVLHWSFSKRPSASAFGEQTQHHSRHVQSLLRRRRRIHDVGRLRLLHPSRSALLHSLLFSLALLPYCRKLRVLRYRARVPQREQMEHVSPSPFLHRRRGGIMIDSGSTFSYISHGEFPVFISAFRRATQQAMKKAGRILQSVSRFRVGMNRSVDRRSTIATV